MGAYAYCRKCKNGMAPPTARQIIFDDWLCGSCGTQAELVGDARNDFLVELDERLSAVEALVQP